MTKDSDVMKLLPHAATFARLFFFINHAGKIMFYLHGVVMFYQDIAEFIYFGKLKLVAGQAW